MGVEELFRDHKSRRDGQSLRHTRIRHVDRFDRFLLAVALAYIVLVGAGPASGVTSMRSHVAGNGVAPADVTAQPPTSAEPSRVNCRSGWPPSRSRSKAASPRTAASRPSPDWGP